MNSRWKNLIGTMGLVVATFNTIDLIFYWPECDYDLLYLGKLLTFIISGAYMAWIYLLKDKLIKSKLIKNTTVE